MRLRSLLFACLILLIINVFGQSKTVDTVMARKTLMTSADSMATLFVKGDIKEYVRYVHPSIVKAMGGKNRMVSYLDSMVKSLKPQGVEFKNVQIAMGSKLFVVGSQLQAYVTQIQELKVPRGRLMATSYLIAISDDIGKNWYFIDTGNHNLVELRKLLPTLSKDMVLPEKQKPIFYQD